MRGSAKRLLLTVAGLAVLAAAGLAGLYAWMKYDMAGGPRVTAPDVLVPEYTGPGSLKATDRAGRAAPP